MNTNINTFNFQHNTVQVINKNGEAWFIAAEIAAMLGYRDSHNLTRILDSDEADTHIMSIRSENGVLQNREVSIINESGFYHATFKSRKESVKQFRKWVTAEVLPQIRKTGGYAPFTTTDERTDLRQAVELLVGRRKLDYAHAYRLVHQRFHVAAIEDLPRERLDEAVAYCHALALDGALYGEVLDGVPKSGVFMDDALVVALMELLVLAQSANLPRPASLGMLRDFALAQVPRLAHSRFKAANAYLHPRLVQSV